MGNVKIRDCRFVRICNATSCNLQSSLDHFRSFICHREATSTIVEYQHHTPVNVLTFSPRNSEFAVPTVWKMTKLGFLRLSYEKQDTLLKLLILSMAAILCE